MNRIEYLFPKKLITTGKEYYRLGMVSGLKKENGGYTAIVAGNINHRVSIRMRNDIVVALSCNCAASRRREACVHEAAAFLALEDYMQKGRYIGMNKRVEEPVSVPKLVKPFQRAEGEYTYFDIPAMMENIEIYDDIWKEAMRYKESGEVKLQSFHVGYSPYYNEEGMVAEVHGSFRDHEEIYLRLEKARILTARCYVGGCQKTYYPGYYNWNDSRDKLCEHLLALMSLTSDYIKEYNPGDATDQKAETLMNLFRKKNAVNTLAKMSESKESVHLEPKLDMGFQELKLSFRGGKEKLYVIRNLGNFVDLVEEKKVWTAGKNHEVDFMENEIVAADKPSYEFIKKSVNEERRRQISLEQKMRYDSFSMEVKGYISLYGNKVDEFFDLFAGKKVPYNDPEKKNKTLTCEYGRPQLTFYVTGVENNGQFEGVKLSGKLPQFIEGIRYWYIVEGDKFLRIDPEWSTPIRPLIETDHFRKIEMMIGRRSLSEFYYSLLPMLKEYVEIVEETPQLVEQFLPPEGKNTFYLDLEEGIVTCKAVTSYGEKEMALSDGLGGRNLKESFRDQNMEAQALGCVQKYFPEYDEENDLFSTAEDDDAVFSLLNTGIRELMEYGEVQSTDRVRLLRVRPKPKMTVGVSIKSDLMNVSILSEDISPMELLDILASYRKKKKYHRLKNGDFVQIEDQSLEELSAMMDLLKVSPKEFVKGKMEIPVYRALYLDKMLEQNESIYADRDKHFKKLVKEFKTISDSDFEVPSSLAGVMRNYQIYGHKWLRTLENSGFGGILADDMGLGKTLQMISVLLAAKEERGNVNAIVIAPASLVYNWQEEFAKFAPELSVCVVAGTAKERAGMIGGAEKRDVLITSYDLLKRDIAQYEAKTFDFEIIDEAQYIKNHSTAAAKAVKVVKSRVRYALTGTPIENRLSELWSIFDYLMPGFLYNYENFRTQFEIPITKNKEENAIKQLKRMVSPFILRRLKEDVLRDLPEKLEEVQSAKFDQRQRQLYDGQVLKMKEMIESQSEEAFGQSKLRILAELTKLRQICCDPSLIFEGYKEGSAKRETCLELVRNAIDGGHRVLLFSQFTSMLALLEEDLQKEKIAYYKITGETPKQTRVKLVKEFNEGATPVFLISLKAGGTGLNLTGADVVIHYDPWWNLAVQNQATDRAHRIGQTKIVTVYKLIAVDSIEEKIVKLQESKKDLADEILSGEMGGLASLSREELLDLL